MDRAPTSDLAYAVDALLPQTQCRRCGHDGCLPYAQAVAAGAPINRCPPGGQETVARLATLLGRDEVALDASLGVPGVGARAVIDEARCIGCTLCIQACPVDAIVGGPKRLHGVLAALCSGCELCLPPCPVDCIAVIPAGRAWSPADADAARERHLARATRLASRAAEHATRSADKRLPPEHEVAPGAPVPIVLAPEARHAPVAAALERARARRRAA